MWPNTGNNRILRFHQDRRVEAAFDNQGAGGGLKNPSSVFVDENGGMFVADTDNNRVGEVVGCREIRGAVC